eukprot:SAG31_NODE_18093_length_647_cov_0.934307_1_plen_40_part_10
MARVLGAGYSKMIMRGRCDTENALYCAPVYNEREADVIQR